MIAGLGVVAAVVREGIVQEVEEVAGEGMNQEVAVAAVVVAVVD